jgi:hypothetical protein
MPALNFKRQFVEAIKSGAKFRTCRRITSTRRFKAGDELALYTGQRTAQCELIGRAICVAVRRVLIRRESIVIYDPLESMGSLLDIARSEGCESWKHFVETIDEIYGLPFNGQMIEWQLTTENPDTE